MVAVTKGARGVWGEFDWSRGFLTPIAESVRSPQQIADQQCRRIESLEAQRARVQEELLQLQLQDEILRNAISESWADLELLIGD